MRYSESRGYPWDSEYLIPGLGIMIVDLVQTTTRDGVRLDGMFQSAETSTQSALDAVCMVHGTGGNFYASTLFDHLGSECLSRGIHVLRINTRGHDSISTAVTARGGQRLGAAYERVDDARHDLAAWLDWLRQRGGSRLGLIGHSLGAVKSLYVSAFDPTMTLSALIAISPPRLSYASFCSSPEASEFLDDYRRAEAEVHAGRPGTLLEVRRPLPMVITASGYVEKYGPDERYDFCKLLPSVRCPALVTLGSIEATNNPAFRGSAEAMEPLLSRYPNLQLQTIAGADHFYTGVRPALWSALERFLQSTQEP